MWLWSKVDNPLSWDKNISEFGGHPLQTCLWGEARLHSENIKYECYQAVSRGVILAMARVETRIVPLLGKVAWIPRGPVYTSNT